ncbi:O-antigen ligase family protein [Deferribacter thermophilus]|uniref:O-antigen ligase family protein n=1 Tax=Deferribacter thermophilus TaxID=53573 RepID=UPI003C14FAA1
MVNIINNKIGIYTNNVTGSFSQIRYSGFLNSHNQYAILIVFPLTYLLEKMFDKRDLFKLLANIVLSIFLFYIFLKTGARTTFLSAVLVYSFYFIIKAIKYNYRYSILFLFILLISGYFIVHNQSFKNRFVVTVLNFKTDSSFVTRFPIWHSAFECFKDKPLIGYGFNNFRKCYENKLPQYLKKHYKAPHVNTTNNAHNFFLHFLAETGIIGTILISMIIFIAIYHGIKVNLHFLSIALLISISGFMMNMNLYIREVSFLFFTSIGFIEGYYLAIKNEKSIV